MHILLEDLPLPDDAYEIIKAPTVLGVTWNGEAKYLVGYSMQIWFYPAENLIFYGTETLSTGY